jgi:hypothetical protein
MEVVFDTRTMAAGKRRQGWRDAICEIYLQVDCQTDPDVEYAGLVREARLGEVTITDAVISPQAIRRGNDHIGRFGKDCYYLGIEHIGAVDIRQSGTSFVLPPGRGSQYHANEPYELHSEVESRQFWIELPRAGLIAGSTPVVHHSSRISTSPAGLAASPPTFVRPSPSRAAAWTRPRDRSSASNSWISSRSR